MPWLILLGFAVVIIFFILAAGVRILTEWEKGVLLTLGRFSGVRGPGLNIIIPIFQTLIKVDMRINTVDIPKQEVITKDNITLLVNAVVYFKVENAADAIIKISNYTYALRQYAQGALRDVIGNSEMDSVLSAREKISEEIKKVVDAETSDWGIDVNSVKIQEIELPAEMKRAMAKQAEAEREKRAAIIISDGELLSSVNLAKAAENLSKTKGALHLRTLRTIREISADPSEKIVVFLPSETEDMLRRVFSKK
ncbi:MAG: slipin family protein [Candidatus Diapherotrites archaeon]|nr:slipin family protein [Candidatus Diapherotrites archaeon]